MSGNVLRFARNPYVVKSSLSQRFGGVVGYRICLTHRRSPVRARAESFFIFPDHIRPIAE